MSYRVVLFAILLPAFACHPAWQGDGDHDTFFRSGGLGSKSLPGAANASPDSEALRRDARPGSLDPMVACPASSSVPRWSDDTVRSLDGGGDSVPLAVVERLAAPDQDWMLDEFGMHQGEDVHAEAFVLSETLLHLTISEFEIHDGDSILLDLHDTPGKEPWADVAVTRESDCGAGVPWERLGGWVRINSDRWSDFRSPDAKPLVVEFWLSGLSSGCESCLHGTVVVPK